MTVNFLSMYWLLSLKSFSSFIKLSFPQKAILVKSAILNSLVDLSSNLIHLLYLLSKTIE